MVHTHNPSVLLKTDCICYLCSSSSTRSSLHVLCHTLLLTGNHVFSWHNFQELSYSPGKETVMLPPTAAPSCVLVYLPVTLFWVCLCSSASANMVLCAACSSEDSFLTLWLASPLLFQMRLEVLALGFLKTVSGFERKWFGVFKSSCVPSSQLDSQISLSRDYRCHVNVFISDVFSQCPRGLNLLLSTLWSRSCCLLNIIGISWKERKHWTGTAWCWTVFLFVTFVQQQSTKKELLKVVCLFLLTLLIWDMGGHTMDIFRGQRTTCRNWFKLCSSSTLLSASMPLCACVQLCIIKLLAYVVGTKPVLCTYNMPFYYVTL